MGPGEDRDDLREFIQVLKLTFDQVDPHYNDFGDLDYIAGRSGDSDNYGVELQELPKVCQEAAAYLKGTYNIVVAWESENAEPRQIVWEIPGRGSLTIEEYLDKKESN